jgi:predicted Zn-ribbon and HTH transcriptional regulator
MKTIVTITIENPSEEILMALLQGNASKQSAVIKTQVKTEKPKSNSLKGKKPVTHEKNCIDCHEDFLPTSNVQKRCPKCKANKTIKTPLEPIEDTIAEVERRQKQREAEPFIFSDFVVKKTKPEPRTQDVRKSVPVNMNL